MIDKNLNDFLFVGDSFTARMENTIKSKNEMVYVLRRNEFYSSHCTDWSRRNGIE